MERKTKNKQTKYKEKEGEKEIGKCWL